MGAKRTYSFFTEDQMSHPAETKSPKAGTGVAETQPTSLPAKTNRGAGTAEVWNAADAQGNAGAKSGSPSEATANVYKPGTGAASPQSTEVKTNMTPSSGSPTQNRRAPDVTVETKALGPTPK